MPPTAMTDGLRPLMVLAPLGVMAALGLRSTIEGPGPIGYAVAGATVGVVSAIGAQRRQLYVGESVAVSTVAFAVVGIVLTASVATFFRGLTGGWSHLLTSSPPAGLIPPLRVVPYTVAWASVMIGFELARRTRHLVLAIVGPIAGTIATILLSVEDRPMAMAQGVALGVGALALAAQGEAQERPATLDSRRRPSATIAALATVVGLAGLVAPLVVSSDGGDRFDLRRLHARPWDALNEPSPLANLKASLKADRRDEVVFTVFSTRPITRWTTATMAHYDGVVWAVADTEARFLPIDGIALPLDGATIGGGEEAHYTIEAAEALLWIPVAGHPLQVHPDTPGPRPDVRVNPATATVAMPDRLPAGARLDLVSIPRPEPSPLDLLRTTTPTVDDDDLGLVPPPLRNLAGDLFEGTDTGPARILHLAEFLTTRGYYDHGDGSRPGHSLARLAEFLTRPERMVGYAEHYAATAGALGNLAGVPTRVVVGYRIPAERYHDGVAPVRADDHGAWIEILTEDYGWVPIDVTPDRSRIPVEEPLGIRVTNVAIPNPPPPPPLPPEPPLPAAPGADETDDADDNHDPGAVNHAGLGRFPLVAAVVVALLGPPVLILGTAAVIVIGLKRRRRRRRQRGTPAERIGGAWHELLDAMAEVGAVSDPGATPSEVVAAIGHHRCDPVTHDAARALADELNRSLFHPEAPDAEAAARAWRHCDRVVAGLRAHQSRVRRLAQQTNPRPRTHPRVIVLSRSPNHP